LETLLPSQQIQSAVLVAGFGRDLEYPGYKGELKSFFQRSLDWKKIKNQCKAFIAIHSDNDQWVPMECNRLFVEKLGAKSIICHNMKHFSGDDGITKLPVVMDLLMSLISSK
jgi:predicted alpha/beta hydrolase family esterase